MKIKSLGLRNYRNCKNIWLDFSCQKTLVIGKNAQGKTNILESIYLLSDLKSPRTSTMTDLIKFNANNFHKQKYSIIIFLSFLMLQMVKTFTSHYNDCMIIM